MSEVNITELSNKVVINDETSVVEISAPGPQGASGSGGSSFTPAADSGSGSPVSGSFRVTGGTNITTAVSGTIVTLNADLAGTVTSVTPQGDNGSGTAITSSGNIKVAGTAPISTTVVGDTITVTHDNATGSGTSTSYPGAITVDAKGHVLSVGSSSTPNVAANNLNDVADKPAALTNLGGTTVGKAVFSAADAAAARTAIGAGTGSGDLLASNNLSEVTDSTARTNLGLGSSSTLDVPSSGDAASGEVVKGNDSRLTDARTPVAHSATLITSGTLGVDRIPALSTDKLTSGTLAVARGGTGSATAPMVGVITAADAAAARTVLSLGTAATTATGDFVAATAVSTFGGTLIDDADAATARTTLGVTNAGSYTGHIETGAVKEYTLDPAVVTARTITAVFIQSGNQSGSGGGTGTISMKATPSGGATVTIGTVSVSNSSTTAVLSNSNTSVAADARLFLDCTTSDALQDVIFSVEYTE